MKKILKFIVIKIITLQAKLVVLRYKPKIIAISGTVGKTTTKDFIFEALNNQVTVRKNKKSLNSEFGVPLTILDCESGFSNVSSWLKIFLKGFTLLIKKEKYPEWLILEVGVDHPGDMKKTAKWLKPNIAVFTTYSDIPVHVEFFESPEELMNEQSELLDYVQNDGLVLLNADDKNVLKLKQKSHVKTITYSMENNEYDFFSSNYQIAYEKEEPFYPSGINFKVNYKGKVFPVNLKGMIGDQYIYPVLVALSIADFLEISVVDSLNSISNFSPVPGRLRILEGINKSLILDDTYNAAPVAVEKALETLKNIETNLPKIAVLGDMLELGRYSFSEHKKIGEIVKNSKINYLITVGLRAESISEKVIELGFKKDKVFHFDKSVEAIDLVKSILEEPAIILVKGSQGVRMEKIVAEIMKDKERKGELLVRQSSEWQGK